MLLPLWRLFKSPLHIQTKQNILEKRFNSLSQNILFLTMYRNFNLFPFQPSGIYRYYYIYFLIDPLGLVLRSTYSWINTIARKPFLTSAVKVLTWLFATTTKICTNAWSKQDRSLYSSSLSYFIYLNASHKLTWKKIIL